MTFLSRHGESLNRIVAAYPVGPGLIAALETYCKTVEDQAFTRAKDHVAEGVCEGLHSGEAKGLKCLKCYMAEQHFHQEEIVSAEIASANRQGGNDPEAA